MSSLTEKMAQTGPRKLHINVLSEQSQQLSKSEGGKKALLLRNMEQLHKFIHPFIHQQILSVYSVTGSEAGSEDTIMKEVNMVLYNTSKNNKI